MSSNSKLNKISVMFDRSNAYSTILVNCVNSMTSSGVFSTQAFLLRRAPVTVSAVLSLPWCPVADLANVKQGWSDYQ